ncbi:MAG: UDP-N-acetylglucosamine 2-epimerase (hydrolyzing) [Bryobacterales bacterium]|nr:UDP-N-acetylglucosamine 2-epimerase (hydrolyzing) [Bryobacterales bacterium]
MKPKRTVCVVLVDRANYGRLKPVMHAIATHPDLELQCIAAGTMVLERFGRPVEIVRRDGFPVLSEVYMELEGSTPTSMAKSVGFGVVEFANEFQRLNPDLVLLIGDRYEALAAAIACAYMNRCLVHVQGGEISGSIDESARHAISRFAQFHFPATRRAAEYLLRMGEAPETILGVGCPGSDIARTMDRNLESEMLNATGSGAFVDANGEFLLAIYHPTTTSYGGAARQMRQLLEALRILATPTILLWPNIDAGADHISKEIRIFRDQGADWLRTITNLAPEIYLQVLASTACAVGNSSSFVRDAGYFGTPVVLVGDRQDGRETDCHAVRCHAVAGDIAACIAAQLQHGRYSPSSLYGDGFVSGRIADQLAALKPYVQKRLHYVMQEAATFVNGYASTGYHHSSRGIQGDSTEKSGAVVR